MRHDQLAGQFLDRADLAAAIAPTIGIDRLFDQLGDGVHPFLAGHFLFTVAATVVPKQIALAAAQSLLAAAGIGAAGRLAAAAVGGGGQKTHIRSVCEIRHFHQQIADVIRLRRGRFRQIILCGNGDDAFIDGVAQLDRATAHVGQNRVQRFGEFDVFEARGDRRFLVNAGRFQGTPIHENVGSGDVTQEIDVVEVVEPIGIVGHQRLAVAEGQEFREHLADAGIPRPRPRRAPRSAEPRAGVDGCACQADARSARPPGGGVVREHGTQPGHRGAVDADDQSCECLVGERPAENQLDVEQPMAQDPDADGDGNHHPRDGDADVYQQPGTAGGLKYPCAQQAHRHRGCRPDHP